MERKTLSPDKSLFITLSFLSIGCLIGAFAAPLQQLEVWHQTEKNQFQQPYTRVFIRTSSERQLPYGFDGTRAIKVAQIYDAATFQKLLLLGGSIITAGIALTIGQQTVEKSEIESEIQTIERRGQKELVLSKIRHKLAMASEAQKQLMREELKALVELAGGDDTLEASEVNETNKFVNANYMLMEGHDIDAIVTQTWGYKGGTEEHTRMKEKFQQWLKE